MECLHATGPRQPCQSPGRIETRSLESSSRLPCFAFMSMVDQVHNFSRLTPHGTGSKIGEVMHRSANSYTCALTKERKVHCMTNMASSSQTMMTSTTQGLFCRKPQIATADCRTCHERWKRRMLNRL